MRASSLDPALERIDIEAAEWFARQRSGEMTGAEAAAFERWLACDDAHRQAFELAEQMWVEVEAVRSEPRMIALRERGERRLLGPRAFWLGPAVAASLAIATLGGWVVIDRSGTFPVTSSVRQEFRTSVGQRTTVKLPDGSVVTLDTDTVLKTAESGRERRLVLQKGRAFFDVAHDPARPFVVVAGDRLITATGTAFGVDATRKGVEVTLVEGHVRVEKISSAEGKIKKVHVADVSAGSRLETTDGDRWSLTPIDVPKETSWLEGQLTYDGARLGDVVADMNRYSDRKIVLLDPRLAEQRLSGVYKAGDVDDFVRILEEYRLAEVQSQSDSRVKLAPGPKIFAAARE